MSRRFLVAIVTLFILLYSSKTAEDIDWRGDYMAPIGDQLSCQSCVAFAVTGVLDWHVSSVSKTSISLSTQYLVDCSVDAETGEEEDGCAAGFIKTELKQIMRDQYMPYAEDYPYEGNYDSERCETKGAKDRNLRNALADVWVHDYIPLGSTPQAIKEALQSGPTINGMYIGDQVRDWNSSNLLTDSGVDGCVQDSLPHAMAFVGWQSNNGNPYYIVRNSYGMKHGDGGYLYYADNSENENCRYTMSAYSLVVGPRKELEYMVGAGKKNFKAARQWCQAQGAGWDLAHIPTEMHNYQVYDMFTATYGRDKKPDASFNFFWIGLMSTTDSKKWVWVEGDSNVAYNEMTGQDAKYVKFAKNSHSNRFAVMNKVKPDREMKRGLWSDKPASSLLRFMCSRYREEACPRISQTALDNARSVTFLSPDGATETLEIQEGSRARVSCMEGYRLLGGEGLCKDGAWDNIPSCFSQSPCEMLTTKDIKKSSGVMIEGRIFGDFVNEGSTIEIECKNGYTIKLDDVNAPSVCENGQWTNLPSCSKDKKSKKGKKRQ